MARCSHLRHPRQRSTWATATLPPYIWHGSLPNRMTESKFSVVIGQRSMAWHALNFAVMSAPSMLKKVCSCCIVKFSLSCWWCSNSNATKYKCVFVEVWAWIQTTQRWAWMRSLFLQAFNAVLLKTDENWYFFCYYLQKFRFHQNKVRLTHVYLFIYLFIETIFIQGCPSDIYTQNLLLLGPWYIKT